MIRKLQATLCAVLAATCSLVFAQSDPTKTVITVNGEAVSGLEYFRRMEFLPGVGKLVGNRFVSSYPGYLAMQQIINERLLLQLAKEKKVYPTQQEVNASISERLKGTPDLLVNLEKVGITRADFERTVIVDICEFKLLTMGVNISDLEVEKFYKDNPRTFTNPKAFKVRMIAVPEADKAKVEAEFTAGKKFEDVAKALSKAPSAEQGGTMGGFIPSDSFAEPTRVELDKTKIGQRTAWIRGETGNWFLFLVEDIRPEALIPLDATLRLQIRNQLMVDRGSVRNNIDKLMMEMRRKAVVTVTQPGLSDMIQEWLKTSTIN